ncbi:P-loop containing nucleoside triphosphate hydrolase protein [Zopfochytrium polystomum]|nr:P-loop containing nucleoside triphosphate hydrolase protein [Zopfochytrium polystomum]
MEDGLFKIFRELNELRVRFNVKIRLPKIAVTGLQSAGKTTFIERTRCPVSYTLVHDEDIEIGRVAFEVNGVRMLNDEDAVACIEAHMETIRQTVRGGFDTTELPVTIRGAHLPNMMIVDLPGLLPTSLDAADPVNDITVINKIVASYLRDPSFKVIVVVKCTESTKTMTETELLNRLATEIEHHRLPDPTWTRRCIMVVNKCDSVFSGWADVDRANNFFAPVLESGLKHYFVSMNPGQFQRGGYFSSDFNRERATCQQIQEYYQSLEAAEETFFKGWIDRLQPSNKWNNNNVSLIGLKKAKAGIQQLWTSAFVETYPELIASLEERIIVCENELRAIDRKLTRVDSKSLQSAFRKYVIEFLREIKGIQQGQPLTSTLMVNSVSVAQYDTTTIYNYENPDDYSIPIYDPSRFGKTYKEDVEHFEREGKKYKFYLSPDQLASIDHLGDPDQGLGKSLSMKQVAIHGVRRLSKCLSYMMINSTTTLSATAEEVAAFGGRLSTGYYDAHKAVQHLARRHLLRHNKAIDWFCACAKEMYSRHTDSVLDHVARRLKEMDVFTSPALAPFVGDVTAAYVEALEERCFEPLRLSFEEDCRKAAFYIPIDTFSGDIMAACMCPSAETLTNSRSVSLDSDDDDEFDIFADADNGIGGGGNPIHRFGKAAVVTAVGAFAGPVTASIAAPAISSIVDAIAGPAKSSPLPVAPQRGGQYFRNPAGARHSTPPNPHIKAKVAAVRTIRDGLNRHFAMTFNAADLIEGGLEEVLPQLPYDIEPERDVAVARQLYFSSVRHLEQSFRRSLEYYLVHAHNEDPERSIEDLMFEKLKKYDGGTLRKMIEDEEPGMRERQEHLAEELEALKEVVPKARRLLKQMEMGHRIGGAW